MSDHQQCEAFSEQDIVTKSEMKAFVGIVLFMGIVELPELGSYWSHSSPFRATYVQVRFSRQRFEDILHHLHLADNDDEDAADNPAAKFQDFLNLLNSVNQRAWNLYFAFSIDEAMVKFQGRIKFLQYAPDKPEKWGIKLYKLCDSTGYMFACAVYTGARTDKEDDEGSIDRVVKDLVEPITGQKPYHLYCDNLYCNIPLALWLQEHSIYITGTLRANRKFMPKEFKSAQLVDKGDSVWTSSPTGISLVKWWDSTEVLFLSTAHDGAKLETVDRSDGKGGKLKKEIPTMAADYNKHMGTVDKHNQLCSYYTYGRRCSKWWQTLFFYFISTQITNSWIIFKALNPHSKMALLEFQEALVYHLSDSYRGRTRSSAPSSPQPKRGKKVAHSVEVKSNPKNETCGFCFSPNPSLWCNTCSVFLHGTCVESHCK